MTINVRLGENTALALSAALRAEAAEANIALEDLPTSDPGVAWAFWNDGGIRKLSDATELGGAGTVTSVALTVPTGFAVAGSPITGSGTLAVTFSAGYQGYTTTEATKLAGIATGATANSASIASEVNTGTDTSKYITPDALAGSNLGTAVVELLVTDPNGSALATGDGQAYFFVPSTLNGRDLVAVAAGVVTVSSSGLPTVQVHNVTDAVDMLSTALTIDANEHHSSTAATPAVIDTTKDDVATGDLLRIDVDGAGTGAKGLVVVLHFRLP